MNLAPDWDPGAPDVFNDQIAAYDAMRRRCPVAHSDYLGWSLFRHADVMRALNDPGTFSNAVSARAQIPNGMDPPEHTAYRRIIEPYFDTPRMRAFEPACRQIAENLVAQLPAAGEVEWMTAFADEFALRIQCAFLGWPETLGAPLREWLHRSHHATRARDLDALEAVALEFDGHVRGLLHERREARDTAPEDVTTRLMNERIGSRRLSDEELVSILRNWTVGEVGTISASIGILAQYLAAQPALQRRLSGEPALLPVAIDEILRLHAPLIANRRVTTQTVELGGRCIGPGERMTLIWASANRDEAVFGNPDEFRLDRDPALNLLYGAGIHVCPGAPLARLELRELMHALLATRQIALVPDRLPVRATYPSSGYSELVLRVSLREP